MPLRNRIHYTVLPLHDGDEEAIYDVLKAVADGLDQARASELDIDEGLLHILRRVTAEIGYWKEGDSKHLPTFYVMAHVTWDDPRPAVE